MSLTNMLLLISHFNIQQGERSQSTTLEGTTRNAKPCAVRVPGMAQRKNQRGHIVTAVRSRAIYIPSEYKLNKLSFKNVNYAYIF